ncbi:unnamed protein product [Mytilus coruscus]|uniref:WSC domain-containing protein n=1 Tax=Mytilus coruscus TaxID=42192 RepID=A0A6J8CP74_MYTCO|nr:unnamed protein product [Mytilus coruscus]
MESKSIWMVVFVFFFPWKVKTVHGVIVSHNRMTWIESLSYCKLASEDSIHNLYNGEYRGWVGGIYLNSQWMFHKAKNESLSGDFFSQRCKRYTGVSKLEKCTKLRENAGCYSNTGAINANGVFQIENLSPSLCSDKCKTVPYFALKRKWCFCMNSLRQLKNVDSSKCTYKCPGSNEDVCGENSHFTVYTQVTGIEKPKGDVDQKLTCSVVVPRNDTFALKPVDCFSKHWTACVISGVTRQLGITDTYESAIIRCSLSNGTILNVYNNLNNLEDGKEYWSNIHKSEFLKWVTSESFDEICGEVERLSNVDCLFLNVKYKDMQYVPLPCKYKYNAICERKKLGDPAVIRQCQTKISTTKITKKETEPSHSKISSNKPPLTSSHLSTNTVYVISSDTSMSSKFTMRRQRKAHPEGNGNHFELGARQPNTAIENRSYEKPWNYLKTFNTGIPECQIYDEAKDQDSFERQIYDETTNKYQHLDFDLRSKQPKFLEAEYDTSMSTLSFPKPDLDKTSANCAIEIVVAKRAQNMRSSIHLCHGPWTNNKSAGQNVAYCDTEIIHTKYMYDTPKQSIGMPTYRSKLDFI